MRRSYESWYFCYLEEAWEFLVREVLNMGDSTIIAGIGGGEKTGTQFQARVNVVEMLNKMLMTAEASATSITVPERQRWKGLLMH
jgi:hypothetical protein